MRPSSKPRHTERLQRVTRHVGKRANAAGGVALEIAVLGAAADFVHGEGGIASTGCLLLLLQRMGVGFSSTPFLLRVGWIHRLWLEGNLVVLSSRTCALQISSLASRTGAVEKMSGGEAESSIASVARREGLVGCRDWIPRTFRHARLASIDVERRRATAGIVRVEQRQLETATAGTMRLVGMLSCL